jgi:hypothetical protein
MTGVVISGATLALVTTSDIKVNGVVFTGFPLSYSNGVVIGQQTVLNLSAASIASTAATSTVIGNFSVTNGTGVYTYSLTSNPGGLFAVSGTSLVNAIQGLTPGLDPITAQGNNGAGSVVSAPFIITVIGSTVVLPSLNFSISTNSQNLMIVMGI